MHLTFSSYIISLLGVALRSDRLAVADLHDVEGDTRAISIKTGEQIIKIKAA